MNYDTEAWYKLYVRESTEDRLLPVLNRALRDFLLRLAKSRTDATILGRTDSPGEDLAKALSAHPDEAPSIVAYVSSMLEDGFLTHRNGRLWITNFVRAQAAKSPGARRQKVYREKNRGATRDALARIDSSTDNVTRDVTGASRGDVTVASRVTSQKIRSDPIRTEPRRTDPIRSDAPERARDAPGGAVVVGDSSNEEPEPDPGRETMCPANLAERLEANGTARMLAEKLGAPIESIRHEIKQFESYWVAGKGMGQRRANWPGKARQWVVEQHGKPGGLKPPGAIEHDRRNGESEALTPGMRAIGAGLLRELGRL